MTVPEPIGPWRRQSSHLRPVVIRHLYLVVRWITVETHGAVTPAAARLIAFRSVTRYSRAMAAIEEIRVTAPAERMRMMRARRRGQGLRELRLVVPDPRLGSVRHRVAAQVVRLDRGHEDEALSWIEAVSEFDAPSPSER